MDYEYGYEYEHTKFYMKIASIPSQLFTPSPPTETINPGSCGWRSHHVIPCVFPPPFGTWQRNARWDGNSALSVIGGVRGGDGGGRVAGGEKSCFWRSWRGGGMLGVAGLMGHRGLGGFSLVPRAGERENLG